MRWIALALPLLCLATIAHADQIHLLNVSYDSTRELYEDIDQAFAPVFQQQTGQAISVEQSHGGSGKQARAVLDGLQADVVTLALGWDITALQRGGLIKPGWQQRLPNNACPYTSTIVFLVRKSNPKRIKDWRDLIRPDVQVIMPNPKTSGGARWAFLAAWGQAAGAKSGDAKTRQSLDNASGDAYITALYRRVAVLDSGARGSTVTFAEKKVGDVLVGWESEAQLAEEEFGKDQFQIIYPSVSVLAEPPVAVVDAVVDHNGTRSAAEAYLKFLYTPAAQEIIAEDHYRPRSPEALKAHLADLPPIQTFTLVNVAGDWATAQAKFFADGALFDRIYRK